MALNDKNQKPNLLFESSILQYSTLEKDDKRNTGRTGVFFVLNNVLRELLNSNAFNITLHFNLQETYLSLIKRYPHLKNINFIIDYYISAEQNIKKYKKQMKNENLSLISKCVLGLKIIKNYLKIPNFDKIKFNTALKKQIYIFHLIVFSLSKL